MKKQTIRILITKILIVVAYVVALFFILLAFIGFTMGIDSGDIGSLWVILLFIFIIGALFFYFGYSQSIIIKEYNKYHTLLLGNYEVPIAKLAELTGTEESKVVASLQKMIDKKFFSDISLDLTNKKVITNTNFEQGEIMSQQSNSNMVEKIAVKCPSCGAVNNADSRETTVVCEYCGTAITMEKRLTENQEGDEITMEKQQVQASRQYGKEKVDMFIAANKKYFPEEKIGILRQRLLATSDAEFAVVSSVGLTDPLITLLVSIFLGYFGIDRFMIGDVGMGILKLLTGGVCGILWLYDCITIMKKVKDVNFNKVMTVL